MPRQRSSRPAARPVARQAPPPAPVHHAPAPAPHQSQSGGGGMLAGIGSTIAQGLAFGTGSAVAHRAVDSIMGPRTVVHEHSGQEQSTGGPAALAQPVAADSCINQSKAFQDCLNANGSDIGKCQFYVDMLNECRRGPAQMMLWWAGWQLWSFRNFMKARHGLRFIFSHIDTLGFGGHIGERGNGMWRIDRSCRMHLNMWNAQVCNQFQKQIDLIETLHIILVISDWCVQALLFVEL